MGFSYRLSKLCGAVHANGNITFTPDGNSLYSCINNRITRFDLAKHTSTTFSYEHAYRIRRIAVSPDGRYLLSVDEGGYLYLGHTGRKIVLARMKLKQAFKVRDLSFSPNGKFFAITQRRMIQVWRTPKEAREFSPFVLVGTFGSHHDDITCITWSNDEYSSFIATGSKDTSVKVYGLEGGVLESDAETKQLAKIKDTQRLRNRHYEDMASMQILEETSDEDEKEEEDEKEGEKGGNEDNATTKNSKKSRTRNTEGKVTKNNLKGVEEEEEEEDKDEENTLAANNSLEEEFQKEFGIVDLNSGRISSSSGLLSGHRDAVVAIMPGNEVYTLYTVAKDGYLIVWKRIFVESRKRARSQSVRKSNYLNDDNESDQDTDHDGYAMKEDREEEEDENDENNDSYDTAIEGSYQWRFTGRHNLKKGGRTEVCSAALAPGGSLLVVGFSDGIFGLYDVSDFSVVHSLSVSHGRINQVAVNPSGDWIAMGCDGLGQLLVWEWQSETYVLKQQGHADAVNCVDYSMDGQLMVTGGDDGKVKLWHTSSGFCFVTFSEHTGPVSAVKTLTSGQAILSASLDGTVRAHDLIRYRNFKTMTTPTPVQLLSLAADPSGEVVCAGAQDPYEIYVWSLQTGKLLDILGGHNGPVVTLDYSLAGDVLASGSWDKEVKLWNVYNSECIETLDAQSDVTSVAFKPDGKELCVATLNGNLQRWDVEDGTILSTIEGRLDVSGGRSVDQKITAANSAATKYFTSVTYSADGNFVLAGGRSKFVCIYNLDAKLLVKKFQLSHDRMRDGVLEKLHSKKMTDGGFSIDEIYGSDSEDERQGSDFNLPGVKRKDDGSRKTRVEVRTSGVRFSPTGREWSAATPEGLLIFSLDEEIYFDPLDLGMEVTASSVLEAIEDGQFASSVLLALQLNEEKYIEAAVENVPRNQIALVVRSIPKHHLLRVCTYIAARLQYSPQVEYFLHWTLSLLETHAQIFQQNKVEFLPALRGMLKQVMTKDNDVTKISDENDFTIQYLLSAHSSSKSRVMSSSSSSSSTSSSSVYDKTFDKLMLTDKKTKSKSKSTSL